MDMSPKKNLSLYEENRGWHETHAAALVLWRPATLFGSRKAQTEET